jgi:hypothetical protein
MDLGTSSFVIPHIYADDITFDGALTGGGVALTALYGGVNSNADSLHTHPLKGDIDSVQITASGGLLSSPANPVNTQSGNHIQNISHSTANGYNHIPEDGTSGYLLAYSSAGVAAWQSPGVHGVHGVPGHTHTSSLDVAMNYSTVYARVETDTITARTLTYISFHDDLLPVSQTSKNLGNSGLRWNYIYGSTVDYLYLVNSSDSRIKTDIEDLTNANSLAFIDSLRPRSYKRLNTAGETIDIINYGLIAQEVEEALTGLDIDKTKLNLIHLPDTETSMQRIDSDGPEVERINPRGLSYMELVAPLIGAVKELKERIEVLERN